MYIIPSTNEWTNTSYKPSPPSGLSHLHMGYNLAPVTNSIPNLWINYSFTKKQMALYLIITYYWLVVYLPLWKMMEFVSWDYDIPNWMEKSSIPHKPPTSLFFYWIILDLFITNPSY